MDDLERNIEYKAGETIQIHGKSVLKDYLACVVADNGDRVYCVTLGTGNQAGVRTEHAKDEISPANDWKGPWPGKDLNPGDRVTVPDA